MDNQQATQYEIGWLAGIIDGEGYLGMIISEDPRRSQGAAIDVQCHVCNTDEEIILKTQSIMRKLGLNPYIRASKAYGKNNKDSYKLMVKHLGKMITLLEAVLPHLTGNKAERAIYILEFCKLRLANPGAPNPKVARGGRGPRTIHPYTEEELQFYDKCHTIQIRGASETTRQAQRKNSAIWKIMKERELNRENPHD